MKQLYTSKKKYDDQMAAGFIAFVGMSEFFGSCRCASNAVDSMYLHYAEMPEKKRDAAAEQAKHALLGCGGGGLQDLGAEVHVHRTPGKLQIVFTTCGFGDLVADVSPNGHIRVERR